MYFRFDIVKIMNQVFFVGDAFEESLFVVGGERLPAGGPGVAVNKAEVTGQNAVGERDIAAHHGVLYLLLERKDLRCGGRLVLSDRFGLLPRRRAGRRRYKQQGEWGERTGMCGHRPKFYQSGGEKQLPTSAALGKRVRFSPIAPWREVIGVVQDVRIRGVNESAPATIYWPALAEIPYLAKVVAATRNAAFVVRSNRAGTAGLVEEVQRAVWSVNAGLPLAETRTMQTIYDRSLARTSFTLAMLVIAGAMALVLGIIGIYGVIAYTVAQRRREVGIRMALGARLETVTWMFVRSGLVLSAAGIVLGVVAAAGLSRLMSSLLFGVTPLDPVTYAGTALVLLAAAIGASYLPARRAVAGNPLETLRGE